MNECQTCGKYLIGLGVIISGEIDGQRYRFCSLDCYQGEKMEREYPSDYVFEAYNAESYDEQYD